MVVSTSDTARGRLSTLERPDVQRSDSWFDAEAQFRDRVSEIQADARHYLDRLRSFSLDCSAAVQNIRRDVRRVRAWAAKNPPMRSLYTDLHRDFEHLDTHLTLLTPMQRHIRRSKTEIKGVDIHRFLAQLFSERLIEACAAMHSMSPWRASSSSARAPPLHHDHLISVPDPFEPATQLLLQFRHRYIHKRNAHPSAWPSALSGAHNVGASLGVECGLLGQTRPTRKHTYHYECEVSGGFIPDWWACMLQHGCV